MIDLNNYDENVIKNFIKETQAKLPEYKVDASNVNSFDILLTERHNCKNCHGYNSCQNVNKGHYTVYENEEFFLEKCKIKKEIDKNNNSFKIMNFSSKALEASLEDYEVNCDSRSKIYKRIIEFMDALNNNQFCKGLYLYGTFAKGKTYTLSVIANEIKKTGKTCILMYFPELIVELKNAFGTEKIEALYEMIKTVDVLMIDDLGSENITPWLRDEVLGPIVNYRMSEQKPMFISSNLSPVQLEEHIAIDKANMIKGQRIVSRMNALMNVVNMDDSQTYKR